MGPMTEPVQPPAPSPTGPGRPALPTPPAWLDDVTGDQALDWARQRNAEAHERLGGPRFDRLEHRIREVLDSPGRIPLVSVRGPWAYNFWTDADHPRGLWRRQLVEDYLDGGDQWDVLVDVDALAAAEGRSWVWHGARLLYPDHDRALIHLSAGGSDADITREFDVAARRWVPGGFERPESKGSMSWIDRDHVWVGADFGEGSMSPSGYPLQARVLTRGAPLADAGLIVRGDPEDVVVGGSHDHTPGFERSWVEVAHDFYHSTKYVLAEDREAGHGSPVPGPPVRLDVPDDADVAGWRDWLLVFLHGEWTLGGRTWPAGSLLAVDLDDFLAGGRAVAPLFAPDGRAFLQGYTATRHHVVLELLVDVVPRVRALTPPRPAGNAGDAGDAGGAGADGELGQGAAWQARELDLGAAVDVPPLSAISVGAVTPLDDDRLWLTVSGFTTPTTLGLVELDPEDAHVVSARRVRQAPELFDATDVEVSQHFATSADGTRVPYFQVGRPGGNPGAPTLLNGYGGFEVSRLPGYAATVGRALLEQGGTYVVANIRGGGEYGPAWHRAALTRHRPRAYEDFEAVARDLIARGVTTPSRLGIQGGSNGGLLTGNMLVRVPELFGAVVIQAPLLDMRRYHHLLAGASWMAEYGDPDDPDQWAFIRGFSPFHLFDPARAYPPTLITTSTRDDRVHPAHARTMAWRMRDAGCDVVYYENIEGGHSGAADNAQRAHLQAIMWEFLWQHLGD